MGENSGAGNESRTRDLNLGKVALYQLSYSRVCTAWYLLLWALSLLLWVYYFGSTNFNRGISLFENRAG